MGLSARCRGAGQEVGKEISTEVSKDICEEVASQENCKEDDKEEGKVIQMAGAIVLVLALLAFPIVVGLSTAALAGVLGHFLWKDAEARHEGSELLDTNI